MTHIPIYSSIHIKIEYIENIIQKLFIVFPCAHTTKYKFI